MECLWTRHAEERQQERQTKLGVTLEEVEEVLRHPEQIVAGDQSALIAQSRRDDELLPDNSGLTTRPRPEGESVGGHMKALEMT